MLQQTDSQPRLALATPVRGRLSLFLALRRAPRAPPPAAPAATTLPAAVPTPALLAVFVRVRQRRLLSGAAGAGAIAEELGRTEAQRCGATSEEPGGGAAPAALDLDFALGLALDAPPPHEASASATNG